MDNNKQTRRTRRREDDDHVEPSAIGRHKQTTAKSGAGKRKSTAANAVRQTPRKQQRSGRNSDRTTRASASSSGTLSDQQRASVLSVLKRANVSKDMMSVISAQISKCNNSNIATAANKEAETPSPNCHRNNSVNLRVRTHPQSSARTQPQSSIRTQPQSSGKNRAINREQQQLAAVPY